MDTTTLPEHDRRKILEWNTDLPETVDACIHNLITVAGSALQMHLLFVLGMATSPLLIWILQHTLNNVNMAIHALLTYGLNIHI